MAEMKSDCECISMIDILFEVGREAQVMAVAQYADRTIASHLASIGVIAAGAAFLFQGAAIAARHLRLALEPGGRDVEIEAGMCAEMSGGLAAITWGILVLRGIETIPLLAISAIVFGATLLFGSPSVYRTSRAEPEVPILDVMARETAAGAAGAQALIGVGAITLGILALIGLVVNQTAALSPLILSNSMPER
jgi:hypothetical protein